MGATKVVKQQRRSPQSGKLQYETKPSSQNPDKEVIDTKKPIIDEESQPNLEVRIGAIFALERISQDSLRDHVQIMEILTAYIRENAPLEESDPSPFERWQQAGRPDSSQPRIQDQLNWVQSQPAPRTDIQTAMSVIGRRGPKQLKQELLDTRHHKNGFQLNLKSTNLTNVFISDLNFARANFAFSRLDGVTFGAADLTEAIFSGAFLSFAWISNANLKGANLSQSALAGAFLEENTLDQDTNLFQTSFVGAGFRNNDFKEWIITRSQINSGYGDNAKKLPQGIEKPSHWHSDVDHFDVFYPNWKNWQKSFVYTPPKK